MHHQLPLFPKLPLLNIQYQIQRKTMIVQFYKFKKRTIKILHILSFNKSQTYEWRYSRMDHEKFFKGCLSQILLGSILEYLDSYPSQFPL